MQILEIVLYDKTGLKKRNLKFQAGKINIITGRSATGKSALIDIVDYCLGKGSCVIPYNLRKHISWFGLKLLINEEEIFIARENPYFLDTKTGHAYISGSKVPETAPKEPNSSVEDLRNILSSKIGITKARFIPNKKQSREEFDINIRHALNYSFQTQSIISSRDALFPAVHDNFKKNDLKNTFPYFLGVISENKLDLLKEKELLEKKLRQYEKIVEENQRIAGEGFSRGVSLITECKSVGLIKEDLTIPPEINEIYKILKEAQSVKPSFEYETNIADKLSTFFKQSDEIRNKIKEINDELKTIDYRIGKLDSYNEEKQYQQLRLKSVTLFKESANKPLCPLCSSEINDKIPKIEKIKKAFDEITQSLDTTTVSFPKLEAYSKKLENEKLKLQENLKQIKDNVAALQQQQEKFEEIKEIEDKYLVTIGRVSLWLESIDLSDKKDNIQNEIDIIAKKLEKLNSLLNDEKEKEKFDSIINNINYNMTEQNKNLKTKVEHREDTISYSPKDVTVMIYDDETGNYYSLRETGSAENHLYLHLITLTAFHRHFIKHNRPVPRFLMLDQPTQVYFPADQHFNDTGEIDNDNDRHLVLNLFNYLFDFVNEQNGNFQVIIMDHANLEDSKFQEAIVEEWRGDIALVPYDWMEVNQN